MSKILAVFGATGQQGSSIINFVLNDATVSQIYKIRAITRDRTSESAQKLTSQNVEVVEGDILNRASLSTALAGSHTVFGMTNPSFTPDGLEIEYLAAKTIADVAVESGVSFLIFSTLPSVSTISGGKYTKVIHFDAKANAERYIRCLPIQSAFFSPGFFMQNFTSIPFLAPKKADNQDDGEMWLIERHNSPHAKMPMIDTEADAGKFVGAILAQPEKFAGKTICGAAALYSLEEVAGMMSKATGKKVVYRQIPLVEWKETLGPGAEIFVQAFTYPEEFGYYGPDTEGLVRWAVENAKGKVVGFEEFLERSPLTLV